MLRYLVLIPLLVVALLLVLFGVQNTQLVTVRFLALSVENLSVSLVIMIAAICGALLVGLLNIWGGIQRSLRQRRDQKERAELTTRNGELQRRIAELERELAGLRAAKPAPAPAPAPERQASN